MFYPRGRERVYIIGSPQKYDLERTLRSRPLNYEGIREDVLTAAGLALTALLIPGLLLWFAFADTALWTAEEPQMTFMAYLRCISAGIGVVAGFCGLPLFFMALASCIDDLPKLLAMRKLHKSEDLSQDRSKTVVVDCGYGELFYPYTTPRSMFQLFDALGNQDKRVFLALSVDSDRDPGLGARIKPFMDAYVDLTVDADKMLAEADKMSEEVVAQLEQHLGDLARAYAKTIQGIVETYDDEKACTADAQAQAELDAQEVKAVETAFMMDGERQINDAMATAFLSQDIVVKPYERS